MDIKTCSNCKVVKPLSDFQANARYRGGYVGVCKKCQSKAAKERRMKAALPSEFPEVKTCVKCGQVKSSLEFRKMRGSSDGLTSWCKDCNRFYQREWSRIRRQDDLEFADRQRTASREWHKRARKRLDAADRLREIAKNAHDKRRSDPDRWAIYTEGRQAYYQRRRVTKKYKLYRRLVEVKRRAEKYHVFVDAFTEEDWSAILSRYDNRCAYCGGSGKLEHEHVIPLCQGGAHASSNIVPACRSCNAHKGKRTPEQAGMRLSTPTSN